MAAGRSSGKWLAKKLPLTHYVRSDFALRKGLVCGTTEAMTL